MWVNIVPRERLAVANQLNYVSVYGMVPVAAVLFALLSTVATFFGVPDVSGGERRVDQRLAPTRWPSTSPWPSTPAPTSSPPAWC